MTALRNPKTLEIAAAIVLLALLLGGLVECTLEARPAVIPDPAAFSAS